MDTGDVTCELSEIAITVLGTPLLGKKDRMKYNAKEDDICRNMK
jgi:hypothetical protein